MRKPVADEVDSVYSFGCCDLDDGLSDLRRR